MNSQHKRMVERLEASAEDFLAYATKLSADDLAARPAPTEWTLHQVIAHGRDTEQEDFLYRLKRMLNEEHPAVENFDQDLWTGQHYSAAEPSKKILSEFRGARRKIVQ